MGFLKGPVTFHRFTVAGDRPRLFTDEHLDRLRDRVARRVPLIASADGVQTGWAGGAHALDTEFAPEKNIFPEHLVADLWVQTDRLPADRLKAYYEADLKALAKENSSGKPSAKQRAEARESARTRLEEEAKDGRWKKWKCTPVAWDLRTNTAYLGCASPSPFDRFTTLWEQTFTASLIPGQEKHFSGVLTPVTPGRIAVEQDAQARFLKFSPFVPGLPCDAPVWCPDDTYPDWLGNEFLLWLWHLTDAESDAVAVAGGDEVTVMFLGGLKVEDPRGFRGNGTMNSDSAVKLPEARAAIRGGKVPRQAALTIVRSDEQFSFVLHAERLAVTAAKLPPPDEDTTEQHARESERLGHVRTLAETIDLLFGAFLDERLDHVTWAGRLKRMQAWLGFGPEGKAA